MEPHLAIAAAAPDPYQSRRLGPALSVRRAGEAADSRDSLIRPLGPRSSLTNLYDRPTAAEPRQHTLKRACDV